MMFPTEDDFYNHLKKIGERIILDARDIAKAAYEAREINITASISPADQVTTVEYSFSKYSDPRITKKERTQV